MYINTLYLANILWLCFHFCFGVLPVCCCARCAQELLNYYASFCVWVGTGLMVSACTLNPVRAAVQSSLYAEPQRYGKIGPQTFSLDFKCARAAQSIYSPSSMCFLQIVLLVRYPLSVIQAFGTSLTTLFWTWSEYLGQNAFRMFCPTYIRCSQKGQSKPRLAKVHGTLSFSDPKAQAGRSLKPKGFAWWVRSRKDTNKAQPATNILVHSKYYHISSYISKTAKMELMRTHMWGKCRRFPALPSGTTLTGNEGSTSQDGCSSNSVDMLAFWCFWHEDTCTNLNLVESLSFFVEHDLCDLKFLFHERQFRRDVQHCHAIIFAI